MGQDLRIGFREESSVIWQTEAWQMTARMTKFRRLQNDLTLMAEESACATISSSCTTFMHHA